MGWTSSPSWATRKDLIAYLIEGHSTTACQRKVLRHCTRGNVLWAIFENKYPDSQELFIACCLLANHGRDYGWAYKDMTESMGPNHLTCPLSYFDEVPDPGSYATEWREKCRKYAESKRRVSALKDGTKISFEFDVRFGDGIIERCFELVKRGRKTYYRRQSDGALTRLSKRLVLAAKIV